MNTSKGSLHGSGRRTAQITGVLYIIGTIAGILSLSFTGSIGNAEDVLVHVSANENMLVMGAIFVLIMGLALAMIPIVLFPLLRKYNETLAVGYVVFRGGLESFTYLAIVVSWLFLVSLSRITIQPGVVNPSAFPALGVLLLETKEISAVAAIIFPIGALMFYVLLFQSRLVPRWLSGWGLAALIPYVAAGLAVMFGILDPLSPAGVISDIPLALQEMVLAVWLIVKGFNSSAVTFELAQGAISQA